MMDNPLDTRKRPFILGLTGSIGMGKSTVAAMLIEEGVPVFDADAEVHRLQAPGGGAVAVIAAAFPGSIGENGGVDRQKLGPMVLGQADALKRLEAILHPAVADARRAFLRAHQGTPIICFDIPLLFEKGGESGVDAVMVVSADPETQRHRVLARPGMTPQKFESILALQMPDAEKRARADYIIKNHGSLAETRAQLVAVLKKLRGIAANHLESRANKSDSQ